ncbi:Putative ribonuclease H protein At1g65750 [Linum perenne]
MNTGGSRHNHSGSTAIGGLIWDDQGNFAQAFSANVGICSITRAEMKAVVEGLKLAWGTGIRMLEIQCDSGAALSLLLNGAQMTHQHMALVAEFQELRSRAWSLSFSHVYRAANCGADYLANLGHSLSFGLHVFSQPDSTLAHWLRYDLIWGCLAKNDF